MLNGAPSAGPEPVGDAEFADLMAPLGPFEPSPRLAVAVSGGADSMALCLLADRWARCRGGKAVALTVDHQLRSRSADEAAQVAGWMAAQNVAHHILTWRGAKPGSGLQAAARQARYDLLGGWCRAAGVLHLLLAHHQDDQAETLLLRLARGSGVDGLAAMARLSFRADLQLLRPLLTVAHRRLQATLEAAGQPWIEDPSNRADTYRRVRLRRLMPSLVREGLDAARLAATTAQLGRARQALEGDTAAWLVRAVELAPAGYGRLHPEVLAAAPEEIALRLLAGLCRTIGGQRHPPRLERLLRLAGELRHGLAGRRTFAGCLFVPAAAGVLVCREPAAVAAPTKLNGDGTVVWDNRYSIRIVGGEGVAVGALGGDGWRQVRPSVSPAAVPPPVLATLPTIMDKHGIFAVPHLGYRRQQSGPAIEGVAFTPVFPLAGAVYCLV